MIEQFLKGKVAIVTGAARGIGEGIALLFAEHGAHVAFTYVSD
ncbi:MAG: SDR family oxidoreductase, partial [Synechococcaceae bacterium WB6_3A_227]|nr:SDR family oxidoreductase [Synechococcaceae bacterium WB6_3A_227]